jgi:hypothetical protein
LSSSAVKSGVTDPIDLLLQRTDFRFHIRLVSDLVCSELVSSCKADRSIFPSLAQSLLPKAGQIRSTGKKNKKQIAGPCAWGQTESVLQRDPPGIARPRVPRSPRIVERVGRLAISPGSGRPIWHQAVRSRTPGNGSPRVARPQTSSEVERALPRPAPGNIESIS